MIRVINILILPGLGIDEDDSKAIIIWRQMSNINLKINNNFFRSY